MPDFFIKDPDAILDYKFDWASWLESGDVILTGTVSSSSGLTVDSSSLTNTGTSVTAWLSGGIEWNTYYVTCHIITSDGRADDRTITVEVRPK